MLNFAPFLSKCMILPQYRSVVAKISSCPQPFLTKTFKRCHGYASCKEGSFQSKSVSLSAACLVVLFFLKQPLPNRFCSKYVGVAHNGIKNTQIIMAETTKAIKKAMPAPPALPTIPMGNQTQPPPNTQPNRQTPLPYLPLWYL